MISDRLRSALGIRVWYGIGLGVWLPMLVRNAHAISPWQIPRVVLFTVLSAFNSGVGLMLRLIFAQRIRAVELHPSPVFILGHWRSGTTYLNELLSCDHRFIWPKGYQCGSPHIFLLLDSLLRHLLGFAVPSKRPMDDMVFSLERPQEDEFALLGLLGKSTLRFSIFPAGGPTDQEYLSLRSLDASDRQRWIDAWVYFLKSVAIRYGHSKRLLLKTPQHTARVRTILSVFPQAKFIHIARNPLDVYASTVKTWNALSDTQGLQGKGRAHSWVSDFVLKTFAEMYACYEEDRALIPEGQLVEVQYEDLVADPVGVLRLIYAELGLGEIEPFLVALKDRLRESANYKARGHRVAGPETAAVVECCTGYAARYGYADAMASALMLEKAQT